METTTRRQELLKIVYEKLEQAYEDTLEESPSARFWLISDSRKASKVLDAGCCESIVT